MKIFVHCIAALSFVFCVPLASHAEIFLAGEVDFFSGDPEPAIPSPELEDLLSEFLGHQDFDLIPGVNGGVSNRQVSHTFLGLPSEITEAILDLRINAGTMGGSRNDGIFFSFAAMGHANYAEAVVARRSFGPIDAIPPYYPVADPGLVGHWDPGEEALIRIDLGAIELPDGTTLNLLPDIAAQGYLDVLVSDDTGVDFMRLAINEPPGATDVNVSGLVETLELRSVPNPFVSSTQIRFTLPRTSDATVRIFEVSGRLVKTIHRDGLSAGSHMMEWNGRDESGRNVSAGVYLYRLETERSVETRRLVRIR